MDSFSRLAQVLAVYLLPLVFALSFHEAAHGFVARRLGDPTAANEGRVSINPLRHLDVLGTLVLPLAAWWVAGFPFGYAKPVPVDIGRLRRPRRDAALVAFAGPAANLLMGLGWALAALLLPAQVWPGLQPMLAAGILVNAAMFVFNMIPVPPLDGGEVLLCLLPPALARRFDRIRFWPSASRTALRVLRKLFPVRLAGRLYQVDPYNVAVFALFLLLMKFHALDNVLMRAVQLVTTALRSLASIVLFIP